MKNILFFLINFLFLINLLSAQNYFNKKNEISFGYFNLLNLYENTKLEVGFKRNCSNFAIRSNVTYFYENNDYLKITGSYYFQGMNQKSNCYELSVAIGLEKKKNYIKTKLYYGVDLTFSYEKQEFENITFYYNIKNYYLNNYIGPSFFSGLDYFIFNNISVSIELKNNIFLKSSKSYTFYTNYLNKPADKSEDWVIEMKPQALFKINFIF